MNLPPQKTKRIDTVFACRKKAKALARGEGKEVRDALFHWLRV